MIFIAEISEPAQTLDFIPLLSEDEALVAELANMEPVSFEHNVTVPSSMLYTIFECMFLTICNIITSLNKLKYFSL